MYGTQSNLTILIAHVLFYVVGIDMGGTFSRVAVRDFDSSKVAIITSKDTGENAMPSIIVPFPPNEHDIVVGDTHLWRSGVPTIAAFYVRQLLGKRFEDVKHIWDDKEPWPFEIVDVEGTPLVGVTLSGSTAAGLKLTLDPEEVAGVDHEKNWSTLVSPSSSSTTRRSRMKLVSSSLHPACRLMRRWRCLK